MQSQSTLLARPATRDSPSPLRTSSSRPGIDKDRHIQCPRLPLYIRLSARHAARRGLHPAQMAPLDSDGQASLPSRLDRSPTRLAPAASWRGADYKQCPTCCRTCHIAIVAVTPSGIAACTSPDRSRQVSLTGAHASAVRPPRCHFTTSTYVSPSHSHVAQPWAAAPRSPTPVHRRILIPRPDVFDSPPHSLPPRLSRGISFAVDVPPHPPPPRQNSPTGMREGS